MFKGHHANAWVVIAGVRGAGCWRRVTGSGSGFNRTGAAVSSLESGERAAGSGRRVRDPDWIALRLMQRPSESGARVCCAPLPPPLLATLHHPRLPHLVGEHVSFVAYRRSRVPSPGPRCLLPAAWMAQSLSNDAEKWVLLSLGEEMCWLIGLGRRSVAGCQGRARFAHGFRPPTHPSHP
jgi:hypothetical protein